MSESPAYRHNLALLRSLKPGDIVQFPRGAYSHYAIYVGNGRVIHLITYDTELNLLLKGVSNISGSSGSSGNLFSKGVVFEDNFFEVAGDSMAKKDNYLDCQHKPYDSEKIVRRAKSKVGEQDYNLLSNNCEHFSTWCRNGVKSSKEVAKGFVNFVGHVSTSVSKSSRKDK